MLRHLALLLASFQCSCMQYGTADSAETIHSQRKPASFQQLLKINYDRVVPFSKKYDEFVDSFVNVAKKSHRKSPPDDHFAFTRSVRFANPNGLWLEFGVWKGDSTKYLQKLIKQHQYNDTIIYAFDSFEGLPEHWRSAHGDQELNKYVQKGSFNVNGRVPFPPTKHIKWVRGWYNETLPQFLKDMKTKYDQVSFVHIDCDLYSSTKVVFENVQVLIKKSIIIVFNEIIGYPEFKDGEMKALWELLVELHKKGNIITEIISVNKSNSQAAAVRISLMY